MSTGESDAVERLAHGPDLVGLDEDGVGDLLPDGVLEDGGVRAEDVIADDLETGAESGGDAPPSVPVLFTERILQEGDRVAVDPVFPEVDQLVGTHRTAAGLEKLVASVAPHLARGGIEADGDVVPDAVAGLLDGGDDDRDGFLIGLEVRGETALVTDAGAVPAIMEDALEGVKRLDAHADGFAKRRGTVGSDLELLEVQRVVGMAAAVEDIQARNREDGGVGAAEGAVERQSASRSAGPCGGHRHAEDRVRPESRFVGASVHGDHPAIQGVLVRGVHPPER